MRRCALGLSLAGAALALAGEVAASPIDQTLLGPPSPTASAALQLEAFRNGEDTGLIVAFQRAQGRLCLSAMDLEAIGLASPSSAGAVCLDTLPGVRYRYDDQRQSIYIDAQPAALKTTRISMRASAPAGPVSHDFGGLLNYSLSADAGAGGRGSAAFQDVEGVFEARVFGPFGLATSGFAAAAGAADAHDVRLDTTWIWSDPHRLITAEGGDFISSGFAWSRPVRLGGFQVRRDFGVRPDMVTIPTPLLSASAAAPSMLDVMLGQSVVLSRPVPAGTVEVSDLPVLQGQGQARLVLRDALGGEQQVTAAYFAAPELLRPGLTDFSLEAGWARRNFGIRSNDYDTALVSSASARMGVSDGLTLQAHAEGGDGLVNLGAGIVTRVGGLGVVSIAAAASNDQGRLGGLIAAAFQARTSVMTFSAQVQQTLGDYQDLAAVTIARGPATDAWAQPPRSLVQLALTAPLPIAMLDRGGGLPSVGLSYAHIQRDGQPALSTLNASLQYRVTPQISIQAAVYATQASHSDRGFFLAASFPLGAGRDATAGVSTTSGQASGFAEVRSQERPEVGSAAWGLRVDQSRTTSLEADGVYHSGYGRLGARALLYDGAAQGQARLDGALVWLGQPMLAPDRIDQAFVVADVGAPGVEVRRQDQPIGLTGRNGLMLVSNVLPYEATRFDIGLDSIGLDLVARQARQTVTASYGAGALIRFGVTPAPAQIRLTVRLPDGGFAPAGALVSVNGGPSENVVGYDGEVFVAVACAANRIQVDLGDGRVCAGQFNIDPSAKARLHVADILCRLNGWPPLVVAGPGAPRSDGDDPARAGAGRGLVLGDGGQRVDGAGPAERGSGEQHGVADLDLQRPGPGGSGDAVPEPGQRLGGWRWAGRKAAGGAGRGDRTVPDLSGQRSQPDVGLVVVSGLRRCADDHRVAGLQRQGERHADALSVGECARLCRARDLQQQLHGRELLLGAKSVDLRGRYGRDDRDPRDLHLRGDRGAQL
jgi:outer membrane usher protein